MILFVFVFVIIVGFVAYVINIYNGLIIRRNRFRNSYSQIDVQLKRRYDLIPNLVETAKSYLKHEKETLEAVINARNQASKLNQQMSSQPDNMDNLQQLLGAETVLSGAMTKFFALMEQYPDLKADQTIASLSEELTSTENRVAFARQAYNDCIMDYNNFRESFPNSIVAENYGFKEGLLFQVENPVEKKAVKVSM
ncbi:MAG: LemA family protein [Candidatus Cloacimonetes bacterium]|nr:LemA family protein [Candidatus Cloacimonadota bacterium]